MLMSDDYFAILLCKERSSNDMCRLEDKVVAKTVVWSTFVYVTRALRYEYMYLTCLLSALR